MKAKPRNSADKLFGLLCGGRGGAAHAVAAMAGDAGGQQRHADDQDGQRPAARRPRGRTAPGRDRPRPAARSEERHGRASREASRTPTRSRAVTRAPVSRSRLRARVRPAADHDQRDRERRRRRSRAKARAAPPHPPPRPVVMLWKVGAPEQQKQWDEHTRHGQGDQDARPCRSHLRLGESLLVHSPSHARVGVTLSDATLVVVSASATSVNGRCGTPRRCAGTGRPCCAAGGDRAGATRHRPEFAGPRWWRTARGCEPQSSTCSPRPSVMIATSIIMSPRARPAFSCRRRAARSERREAQQHDQRRDQHGHAGGDGRTSPPPTREPTSTANTAVNVSRARNAVRPRNAASLSRDRRWPAGGAGRAPRAAARLPGCGRQPAPAGSVVPRSRAMRPAGARRARPTASSSRGARARKPRPRPARW